MNNIRTILPLQDEILNTETEQVNLAELGQEHLMQIINEMCETMIFHKGLGLAANQVGYPYRICVITGAPIRAMINPRIVSSSEETSLMPEGCLSYPGFEVKIRRPAVVKVRYTQPNGEVVTEEYAGLTSRIVQHEIDHLDGVTILDRAHPIHLEQADRKYAQLMRKTKNAN